MASHNVFMSHYSGDVNRLRRLKELLAQHDCDVRNSSAEEDKGGVLRRHGHEVSDATIARYLRRGIKWAGSVIVIIGEHTHERYGRLHVKGNKSLASMIGIAKIK